jgi:ATP-dependent exoDNAse (exonuclease V) beta subunit
MLQGHLARGVESAEALRRRLRAAAEAIDLASIFTIHGFCAARCANTRWRRGRASMRRS